MTPLEAVKRLAETDPYAFQPHSDERSCVACNEWASDGAHASDCPWLALPQIVAALEHRDALYQDLRRANARLLEQAGNPPD